MVMVRRPGADSDATTAALEAVLADVPTADVMTADEYKDSIVGQLNQLLNLLYGLLP